MLLYHAGLPLPNGFLGVDVFFVISGFLITGILVRELVTTGSIGWARFVGRRIRRLLPAAILVLVVTALVAWFVVPGLRRREVGGDIRAAALYVVNWRFAGKTIDPPLLDTRQSAVQHFWSLAVEEQFYVVWPLALIALALALRRLGRRPTPGAVGVLLAAIVVPSFGYAVWLGTADPGRGYFVTTTRAWELGVGAALAVWCAGREAPNRHTVDGSGGEAGTGSTRGGDRVAAAVGWAGLAAVIGAVWWLPRGATMPGGWTLVPTLGAAAVLYAGWTGTRAGPVRVLGTAPMVWIGGLSYSLYLWHWPAVILTEWALHGLSGTQKVLVVALSVLPAWLSHRFLESPIHHSRALAARTRPVLAMGLALSAVGALAALPLTQVPSSFRTTPVAGSRPAFDTLGAATLGSVASTDPATYATDDWEWLTPDPQLAGKDRPRADVDRCQVDRVAVEPVACEFGVTGGATTVALVGDAQAMQWLPALERLAPARGWRIVTFGKSACTFASGSAQNAGNAYSACDEWNRRTMDRLRADPPELLLTSGHALSAGGGGGASRAALVTGLADRWTELGTGGIPVVVLGASPVSPNDLDVCVARRPHEVSRCAFDRDDAVAGSSLPVQREASASSGTPLVDPTAWICPVAQCPVAIGHVVIHRPGDLLTASYVRTLAPLLGLALDRAAPAAAAP